MEPQSHLAVRIPVPSCDDAHSTPVGPASHPSLIIPLVLNLLVLQVIAVHPLLEEKKRCREEGKNKKKNCQRWILIFVCLKKKKKKKQSYAYQPHAVHVANGTEMSAQLESFNLQHADVSSTKSPALQFSPAQRPELSFS